MNYILKISKRSRRMRVAVFCDGKVVVTVPKFFPDYLIEEFLNKKSKWILGKVKHFSKNPKKILRTGGRKDFIKYKQKAREFVESRILHFNDFYSLSFNKISIKKQKTRWGSCSKKKNLNFNYKIVFLPHHLSDYLIVHELCHIKEFNHSPDFWKLVSKTIPRCKEINKELKKIAIF